MTRVKKFAAMMVFFTIANFLVGQNSKTYLFAGTYTDGLPNKGIYVYQFNSNTGSLTITDVVDQIINPSFLTIAPNGKYLYACTDTKLPGEGSVTAFAIDSILGRLSKINKQSSGGVNPIYLMVSNNNKTVAVGNYSNGTAAILDANEDGSLSPITQSFQFADSSINKTRQESSHIHATVFSPDDNYLFMPDLGADKIRAFKFEASGRKTLINVDSLMVKTKPGSGPRHLIFHPNNSFAYCVEELSGTISGYSYLDGKLTPFQRISAYSDVLDIYSGADIHISPDGLFLYTSNRGDTENSIAIFSIDINTGLLTLIGHQSTFGLIPRNFTLDPAGKFLLVANQLTNNIVVFKRDQQTGLLTYTNHEVILPQPSCLKMRTYFDE